MVDCYKIGPWRITSPCIHKEVGFDYLLSQWDDAEHDTSRSLKNSCATELALWLQCKELQGESGAEMSQPNWGPSTNPPDTWVRPSGMADNWPADCRPPQQTHSLENSNKNGCSFEVTMFWGSLLYGNNWYRTLQEKPKIVTFWSFKKIYFNASNLEG